MVIHAGCGVLLVSVSNCCVGKEKKQQKKRGRGENNSKKTKNIKTM
jgi:hypothetical protein